jgi:rhodanese-related sulfurtransferase
MKILILPMAMAFALLAGLILGCRPETGVSTGYDDVVYMSKDELKAKIDAGDSFKIVDVLSAKSYGSGHISGAISIPIQSLEEQAPKMLKKDETIVVYCASYDCLSSTEAAKKLTNMGYSSVFDYKGGIKEWMESGLPIETAVD